MAGAGLTQNYLTTLANDTPVDSTSLKTLLESVTTRINNITERLNDPKVDDIDRGQLEQERKELQTAQKEINDSLDGITEYSTKALGSALATASNMQSVKKNRMITNNVISEESQHIMDAIGDLKDKRNNRVRMAEINTYYSLKYKGYGNVAKLGTFLMLIILALSIMKKSGILPNGIYNLLVALIIVVGGAILLYRVYDLYTRDNMSFQEKSWSFDPNSKVSGSVTNQNGRHKPDTKDVPDGSNNCDTTTNTKSNTTSKSKSQSERDPSGFSSLTRFLEIQ